MGTVINPAAVDKKDREEYLTLLRAEVGEEQFAKMFGQAVARPADSIIDPATVIAPVVEPAVTENDPTPGLIAEPVVAPIVPVVAPTPVVVAPIVPAELPEQRYEYQPTDEVGRPLGGKQVIKYKTAEELTDKLRDQSIELVRKLRQVTRNNRLGISEDKPLPADAERFTKPIEFIAKELTAEERFQISQDLNDPAKFTEARDRLLESAIGASPEDLRKTLNSQQIQTMQLLARANASTFMETHPEFYACQENLEVVTNWMLKNRLAPNVKNFETAHSTMQEAGLLLAPPIVREVPQPAAVAAPVVEVTVPKVQAPVAEVARISEQPQPQPKHQARVPSGLNSRLASGTGTSPETPTLTLAEFDAMSSEEYKKRVRRDPSFPSKVDKMYADLAAKRQSQLG